MIQTLRLPLLSFAFTALCTASAQMPVALRCEHQGGISPEIAARAQGYAAERGGGTTRYVQIKVIIASMPGPGGDACTPSKVQRDLDGLNAVFARNAQGIQFTFCGPVQVVDNESLYTQWNYSPATINPWFEPGYLTLIYCERMPNGLGGYQFGDMVYVPGITSIQVLAHEVGHALGLLHTHDAIIAAELVDGSNCTTAGDFVCDTPAEPDLSQPGMVQQGTCAYIGTATDANGDTYTPMMGNIMSYAPCQLDSLTPGQAEMMLYVLDNVKSYLHTTEVPVLIDPFETRQCHNSGPTALTATPVPGTFVGPLVNGNTIENAPNAPGEYFVNYLPDVQVEDSATFVDQVMVIHDFYGYYAHGTAELDSLMQTIRAGISGRFTAVDFMLYDPAPNTYRLRIYSGTGFDAVLISESFHAMDAMTDTAWVSFPVNAFTPLDVEAIYTLELKADHAYTAMTSMGADWAYMDYARGYSNAGMGNPFADAVFRTWVRALPPCQEGLRYYELFDPPNYNVLSLADTYCPTFNEAVPLIGALPSNVMDPYFLVNDVLAMNFIPAVLGEGEHTVGYVTTTFNCTDTSAYTFGVSAPEGTIVNLVEPICAESEAFTLEAEPAGGTFTIDGTPTDLLDPAALGVGAHTAGYIWEAPIDSVAFRDQYCCGVEANVAFGVTTLPVGGTVWQTFTPAFGGRLDSIKVSVNSGFNVHTFSVRLYEGAGIGGTLLGSDTINVGSVTGFPDLSGDMHPEVVVGQPYTLWFERLADGTGTDPTLFRFGNDHYAGGAADINGLLGSDLYFSEYVSRTYDCSGELEVPFVVEVCTGVNELVAQDISVAPNPFTTSFTLRADTEVWYVLHSSVGAEILHGRVQAGTPKMLDTGALAAGVYSLRCSMEDGTVRTVKLMRAE